MKKESNFEILESLKLLKNINLFVNNEVLLLILLLKLLPMKDMKASSQTYGVLELFSMPCFEEPYPLKHQI